MCYVHSLGGGLITRKNFTEKMKFSQLWDIQVTCTSIFLSQGKQLLPTPLSHQQKLQPPAPFLSGLLLRSAANPHLHPNCSS